MSTLSKALCLLLAGLIPLCSSSSLFTTFSNGYQLTAENGNYDDDFMQERDGDYFFDEDSFLDDDDTSDDLLALREKYNNYQIALNRLLKKEVTEQPENYKNTLWHCLQFNFNKEKGYLEDDTVDCFSDTYEWDLDRLDPERMPQRCKGWDITPYYSEDLSLSKEEAQVSSTDDYVEPCLWWHLWYGDFLPSSTPSQEPSLVATESNTEQPSMNPTMSPSIHPTISPSFTPTSLPTMTPSMGSAIPTFTQKPSLSPTLTFRPSPAPTTPSPTDSPPSSSPSEDLSKFPSQNISPFVLTLTFSLQRKGILNSPDDEFQTLAMTRELLHWTSAHLKYYLEEALGVNIIAIDSLESAYSERSRTYLMEVLEYGVIYYSPEDVVPTSQTLDLLVQSAFVGKALDDYVSLLQDEAKDPILKSTLYAEIVVDPTREVDDGEKPLDDTTGAKFWTKGFITVIAAAGVACFSMIVLTFLLCSARARARRKFLLATQKSNSTTSNSSEDDDQQRQPSQPPVNYDSDGTSVYSYVQHDQEDDISFAPSFLHAMNERSALGDYYDGNETSLEHSPQKYDTSHHQQPSIPNKLDEIVTTKLCRDDEDKIMEMRTPNEAATAQQKKSKEQRMKEFGDLWDTVDDDSEENIPPNLFNDSASEEEEPPAFMHHKDKYAAPIDSNNF